MALITTPSGVAKSLASMTRGWHRQHGVALLLFLTVLTLAAASLVMYSLGSRSAIDRRKERAPIVALAQAREAILGYATQAGRLPRPAISAVNGLEREVDCAGDEECTGFLPWVSLGLQPGDGWGNLLRYSVTPVFAQVPLLLETAVPSKNVLTAPVEESFHAVDKKTASADCLNFPCFPVVIFSTGARHLGMSVGGISEANVEGVGRYEALNFSASVRFYRGAIPTADGTQHFDDMIVMLTKTEVVRRMNAVRLQH